MLNVQNKIDSRLRKAADEDRQWFEKNHGGRKVWEKYCIASAIVNRGVTSHPTYIPAQKALKTLLDEGVFVRETDKNAAGIGYRLTGFADKQTPEFVKDAWKLYCQAFGGEATIRRMNNVRIGQRTLTHKIAECDRSKYPQLKQVKRIHITENVDGSIDYSLAY